MELVQGFNWRKGVFLLLFFFSMGWLVTRYMPEISLWMQAGSEGFEQQIQGLSGQDGQAANPELSKLMQVLDTYRNAEFTVIYDGREYSAEWSWRNGRYYLARNAADIRDAAAWIHEHAYRTGEGNPIYFRYPDGSERLMRDVFLEKLAMLNQADGGRKA